VRQLKLRAALWVALSTLAMPSCHAQAGALQVSVRGAGGLPLPDAVVYAVPVAGMELPAPKAAEIDQRNRMFVPSVTVVQTGAAVSFPNSDNIRHQVYSFSKAKTFNIKLYSGRPAEPVVFDQPGVAVLGCNIHDRMIAWVVVVDTPWFDRTDAAGAAVLTGLPSGEYLLNVWSAGLQGDAVSRRVMVSEGSAAEHFVLDVQPLAADTHASHGGSTP